MRITINGTGDAQRERPMAECSICGGALYRGESCYWINGACYCEECLLPAARELFAAHRWICGEEERR